MPTISRLLVIQTVCAGFLMFLFYSEQLYQAEYELHKATSRNDRLNGELVLVSNRRVQRVTVDVIEVNLTKAYTPPIRQVIFWEWDSELQVHRVRGWIHEKDVTINGRTVRYKDWLVQAREIIFTQSYFDPEAQDRKYLPIHERRGMPW